MSDISESIEKRLIYCFAFAAFFFQFECFMVVVSLPDLSREMNVSRHEVSYVVSGYMLGVVTALLQANWVGQRLGFWRIFMAGIYIATIATFLCAVAPNLILLILFRVVQGVGVGAMVGGIYAILPTVIKSDKLGRAFGILSASAGAGMVLGLPIGGLISSRLEWPWLFFGTMPFLCALILLIKFYIPQDKLIIKSINTAYQYRDVLKTPSVTRGLFILFIFQGVMAGFRFLTPFLMEHQNNISSTISSLIFLFYPACFLVFSVWAGKQADSYSPKRLMLLGGALSLMAFSFLLVFFYAKGAWHFVFFLILIGSAAGLFTAPNNVAIVRGLPASDIQKASSLIPISLNIALMFGTFSFGLLTTHNDPKLVLYFCIAIFIGLLLYISTLRDGSNNLAS